MKFYRGWPAGLILMALVGCSGGTRTNSNIAAPSPPTNTSSAEVVLGPRQFISELRMAKDDGSGVPADASANVFGESDQTIHCVAMLKEPKSGTRIRFSWWVVEAEGAKNEKIEDVEYTTKAGEPAAHSHVLVPKDWPIGKYRVDVYVNGALDGSIPFSVQ